MFHAPEKYRITWGNYRTLPGSGPNGAYKVPHGANQTLMIIASDGEGWEHVSVHVDVRGKGRNGGERTPNWTEMCYVKDLFWDGEDVVIQYHPRASQYVTNHPHVLHLWRPNTPGVSIPEPPAFLVGSPDLGELSPSEGERMAVLARHSLDRGFRRF